MKNTQGIFSFFSNLISIDELYYFFYLSAHPPQIFVTSFYIPSYLLYNPEMAYNVENRAATKYWIHRSFHQGLNIMRLAKDMGLFPKKERWRNVQEHELVEAEVADVLAVTTGCSAKDREDLFTAALVHDVGKKKQRELIDQKGDEGSLEAFRIQSQKMAEYGVSPRIIALTESCGHTSLVRFLKDPTATDLELSDGLDTPTLILHYADDITKNTDLVTIDERMDALENRQPPYPEATLGGDIFGGRTYYQVQRIVGHLVEGKLAAIIGIEPEQMQGFIISQINERIRQYSQPSVAENNP